MDDLFSSSTEEAVAQGAPLAARMRPRTLEEFVGQSDIVGQGAVLRKAIEEDTLSSLILYGPAGTGKTSLARIIANTTSSHFSEISAVSSGVADLRKTIDAARDRLSFSRQKTILFIDEIHRFTKSQQDALLHAVEDNVVTLIGATTENPFFEVNAPLISRSRVVELHSLSDEDICSILHHALEDERGYHGRVKLEKDAESQIVLTAGGDARVALTTLELAITALKGSSSDAVVTVDIDAVSGATLKRPVTYDKDGDTHYDVISAFIKSMRGSDPDASVYWLARMIEGGEDPKFIARRIMVFASEDIGNADPQALLIATAAVKAAEFIGWPECRINLSQAAIYMALAPKSNASYTAIDNAIKEVRSGPRRDIPSHLRDRSYSGAKALGRGDGYRYPHDYPDAMVRQRYLPEGLDRGSLFIAGSAGWEAERADVLRRLLGQEDEE